jgi:single-stranded-DNA-specific exonuclease
VSAGVSIVVCDMNNPFVTPETQWAVNPYSWLASARLSKELGIPQVVAMVLAGRGLSDPTEARQFLDCSFPLPDPFLFSDMQGAVGTLLGAIDAGRKVVVHGDYDADGITATALLVVGLRQLGARVDWYLPSRFHEGYGLSRAAVETIAAADAAVLVTVDCGVNYPDEVALARELGLEVVVVDHHEPGPRLPECHLIHHLNGDYPHGELCGVGLALKVMHGLHIERAGAKRDRLPAELLRVLDLVAVGTVADLAPLKSENRYYVREGIKLLNLGQRVGLRALTEVAACSGSVDSGAVAFRLAPRLNAAGRLADPSPPLRLLLCEDEVEAKRLAGQLHELNGERQDIERAIFEAAQRQVTALAVLPTVLVLADPDWHEGVLGVVASRMVESYHRPTVLLRISDGVAKGSGRSIPGYDLLSGLAACSPLLSIYGGHTQAAGLTLESERVEQFRKALCEHAGSALSDADLVPKYRADAVLTAEELSADTALALTALEPFGSGNPRPRFLLVDTLLEDAECTRNRLHLKCRAQVGGVRLPAIGFGMGSMLHQTAGERRCLVGAQLKVDEWQGSVRAQLVLERIAQVPDQSSAIRECTTRCGDAEPAAEDGTYRETPPADAAQKPGRGIVWPPYVRDLRGHPGRLTSLAQVLATQEPAVLFTASALRTAELLGSSIPLEVLVAGGVACVDQGSTSVTPERLRDSGLAIVEWGAAGRLADVLRDRAHAIALDPPFRGGQVRAVTALAEAGATVHLLYGEQERKDTCTLLRYLVHPRYAMVCLYKAMQSGEVDEYRLYQQARAHALSEAHVVLTTAQLREALAILRDLGLERVTEGRAKLDARQNAAYRKADADYQECLRLCLIL